MHQFAASPHRGNTKTGVDLKAARFSPTYSVSSLIGSRRHGGQSNLIKNGRPPTTLRIRLVSSRILRKWKAPSIL